MATKPITTANKKSVASSARATAAKKSAAPKKAANEQYSSLLEKLFIDMLKDTYWAEKHLVEALKNMQSEATTDELQEAFEDHRYITEKHVSRLEKVFALLKRAPEAKKCDAMEGLTNEAKAMIQETQKGTMTRDAALIIAAQKVEHYEIATYGSLVQVALTLGHDKAASILEKTLLEEENTDRLLTDIAEANINPMADEEPAEEEESEDE